MEPNKKFPLNTIIVSAITAVITSIITYSAMFYIANSTLSSESIVNKYTSQTITPTTFTTQPTTTTLKTADTKEISLAKSLANWNNINTSSDKIICSKNANQIAGDGSQEDLNNKSTLRFDFFYNLSPNDQGYYPLGAPNLSLFKTQIANLGWKLCAQDEFGAAGSGAQTTVFKNSEGNFIQITYLYGVLLRDNTNDYESTYINTFKKGEEYFILMTIPKTN